MPQPTPSDVHVNQPLTNISIAYIQDDAEFICDKVFPNVPVLKQSDRYFSFDKDNWFRTEAQPRGLSEESAGSGFTIDSTPNYFANVQAIHKDIDDQLLANQDNPLDLDMAATMFVSRQLLLRREKDWATKYFATSIWTGGLKANATQGDLVAGTDFTAWSTAGSNPITDIRAQMIAVKQVTGFKPNTFVMGEQVWLILQDHPEFLDRIKYTQRGIVTPELFASVLGIEKVLIAGAVQNTAKEGATNALSFIFGKNALLCYAAPAPSLMMPSAGYTFSWTGYLGAGANGNRIKRFRIQHKNSDRVEGEMAYDQKVVAADLGAFFSNAVA
jgi:hypothetical protein